MTREPMLEKALRMMLKAGRAAVVARERMDYWQQFGTASLTCLRAEARYNEAIAALECAEMAAHAALRGNVTDFEEVTS